MGKVARIVSVEFNSSEDKNKTAVVFRSRLNEFSPGVELLIAVNTSETELLSIQVFPDLDTCEKAMAQNDAFTAEIGANTMRDVIAYEGEVDYWFQQIKYFGGDAIRVSGVGA